MSGRNVPTDVYEVLEHFNDLEQEPETVELVRDEVPTHFFVDDPNDRYYAWCSHCQEFVGLCKSRHRDVVECPCCGAEGTVIHTWRGYKHLVDKVLMYIYSKSVKSPEDTITARAIYMEYRWGEKDRFGEMQLPWNVEPYMVVDSYYVFTYGQWAAQVRPINNWKMNAKYPCGGIDQWTVSRSINDRFAIYGNNMYGTQNHIVLAMDNDSIDYAVDGTPFRYVWSEIRDTFLNAGNKGAYVKLFAALAKHPFAVETLAKLGKPTQHWLYDITEGGWTGGGVLNWRGKTIKKMFRYNFTKEEKAWLRQTRSTSLNEGQLFNTWQWLRKQGNTQITLQGINDYRLTITALKVAGEVIDLNRLMKYLERQRLKHPGYTLTIDLYTDYLRYCQRLNMDTTEKSTFMPKNLVEAHDTLIREWREIQELRQEEERRKASLKEKRDAKSKNHAYKKLRKKILQQYSFEADGMTIYVPKKLEELVDEGIAMHSCVATYVDRVAKGMTIVVFIRSAEDLKERIGTMEISRDGLSIIQARAKYNRDLPPEAAEFVQKFKEAKIERHRRTA